MDISEIISSLSEDDINQLKNVAGSILGSDETNNVNKEQKSGDTDIMQSLNKMSKMFSPDDERTALIKALKPMLSESKQHKADEAIKILRLIQLVPLLKDAGFLKDLL